MQDSSTDMGFDYLHPDILLPILRSLPWYHRIRAEGVCRVWKDQMPYSDLSVIRMEDADDAFDGVTSNPSRYELIAKAILQRAGVFLKRLDLRTSRRCDIPKGVLRAIGEYCTHLDSLALDSAIFEVGSLPVLDSLRCLEAHIDRLVNEKGELIGDAEDVNINNGYDVYPMLVASELFSSLLASMPSLQSLTLLLNAGPRIWLRCPKLTECVICSKQLETNQLRVLFQNCSQLSKLHLMNARIRNVYDLPQMDAMKELHLYALPITDGDLALLCQSCPLVEDLVVHDCDRHLIFDSLRDLHFLKRLEISQQENWNLEAILNSLPKQVSLESIIYTGLNVTDACLALLAQNHQTLHTVYLSRGRLSGRNPFTSYGVALLVTSCSQLQRLSFNGSETDNTAFYSVLDSGVGIRYLDVCQTRCTENGLLHFALLRTRRILSYRTECPVLEVSFGRRRITVVDRTKRAEFFDGLLQIARIDIT